VDPGSIVTVINETGVEVTLVYPLGHPFEAIKDGSKWMLGPQPPQDNRDHVVRATVAAETEYVIHVVCPGPDPQASPRIRIITSAASS
jgi:hypothetical protein